MRHVCSWLVIAVTLTFVLGCSDNSTNSNCSDSSPVHFVIGMEWEYIMEVISIQWIDDIPINYYSDTTYYNVKLKLEAPQPGVDPEGSLVLKVRDSMFLVPNGPNEEFFSTQGYFSESCNGISFTGNGCGPLTFECDLSQFHDSILYLKSPFQTGVQWTCINDSIIGQIDKKYVGSQAVKIGDQESLLTKVEILYDRDRNGVFEEGEKGCEFFSSEGLVKRVWERNRNYIDTIGDQEVEVTLFNSILVELRSD